MKTLGAIILAAGKGKRLMMKNENKVTLALVDKPMIRHIIEFMNNINIKTVVVVVGFAKQSVVKALAGFDIIFAEQRKRLGTGHAVSCALKKLPANITDVLVVYGDDAVLYSERSRQTINKLFELHYLRKSVITFLTIEQENPKGLGRIVRDKAGKLIEIIEEKDADDTQRKIQEINPGCFVFSVSFLQKYLPKISKSPASGEYYLTSLIDLAIKQGEVVETLKGGKMAWRGVNTPDELLQAKALYSNSQN